MKRVYAHRPVIDRETVNKYLEKVKARFAHDPCVFLSFVKLVIMYLKRENTLDDVNREVGLLFKGYAEDLIDELIYYLRVRGQ
ncbi:SIN3-like protein [Medicago truncatula]|uniref:SIN3-like protein n=1 Tax=Medicago truncatula TaxID=3880 RepID=A0A072TVW0_MEDTR|nr:SIN3-like protein [Medicago truncatula]